MHQQNTRRQRTAGGFTAALLLASGFVHAAQVRASAPTAEMMAPIDGIVAFMTQLPPAAHADVFVGGADLVIVENFPPYLFRGAGAAALWEQGFRQHIAAEEDSGLAVKFGPARDFSITGDRAYFCLPTTWTGLTHGRPFEEHGAWAFVVQHGAHGWRILAYGWGETAHAEPAP
jgi:hypothetical protein